MNSNENNKVAGAILGMLTLAMGVGFFSNALVSPKPVAKAGYELPDATASASSAVAAPAAEAVEPIAKRLASADLAKGEASFKKCMSCHTASPDGKNGTGPGLYGVVGRAPAAHPGFGSYSASMKENAPKIANWSYEALDKFLTSPKGLVSGTSMSFAGVPRADERASLILYLRSLAATPKPLP